jgi:hypothetical protein
MAAAAIHDGDTAVGLDDRDQRALPEYMAVLYQSGDINQYYNIGVNDATLILTRKLPENLLINILRKKYGIQ